MPCSCEGYPEPKLDEQVRNLLQEYERLLKHHKDTIAELDRVKAQNERLLKRLAETV